MVAFGLPLVGLGKFGSKVIPADKNKAVKLRWRNLPEGEYYFVFSLSPHNPNCCLKGDMSIRSFYAKAGAGGITA